MDGLNVLDSVVCCAWLGRWKVWVSDELLMACDGNSVLCAGSTLVCTSRLARRDVQLYCCCCWDELTVVPSKYSYLHDQPEALIPSLPVAIGDNEKDVYMIVPCGFRPVEGMKEDAIVLETPTKGYPKKNPQRVPKDSQATNGQKSKLGLSKPRPRQLHPFNTND